ncbi:hypothetical protein PC121_g1773 [Phytophthora cactorum]|nr:hypothetical protein PC120_g1041 [Phytophthora cactorum]KAG3100118.1 hypothetical protein PC121_g1773 [Phytophthora cactorum]
METLRGVFPAVPTEALLRVLEICDQSVAVASTWLLENEWQDLLEASQEEDDGEDVTIATNVTPNVTSAAPVMTQPVGEEGEPARQGGIMVVSTEAPRGREEDFESEDEDEEDGDEEDMYYDSEDEGVSMVERILPLAKRIKITTLREEGDEIKTDDFWVAFDGKVVIKSMIELLNTTLSKLAHGKVVLLSIPAKELDRATAATKLKSILSSKDSKSAGGEVSGERLQSSRNASSRRTLASLLNGEESGKTPSGSESTTTVPEVPVGQKRKREFAAEVSPRRGYFAYFFPVKELDMVWRTVMHAHLFKGRFGENIEFRTASSGSFSTRDFDELMHIHTSTRSSRASSLVFSPLSSLKCCLILPCTANEDEIFRVGRNIHTTLKIKGSLYFQVVDTPLPTSATSPRSDHLESPNEDENLTEERFRQFARYRVKEEELDAAEPAVPSKNSVDSYMSYQQPRRMKYCLEVLDASKWSSRLAD